MPTIGDVAKRAGVSIGTVSNVIRGTARVSQELRERVTSAIREIEYYPGNVASEVRIMQTCMLGLILPDITNPFFPEIMRGAEDRAFERGYLLVTANTDEQIEREREIVSALRLRRVDGILLAAASGDDTQHIQALNQAGIPLVYLDRAAAGIDTDAVLLDNVRGAHRCVRHLIRQGYKDIAIITGPLSLQSARERYQGYQDALREAQIEIPGHKILVGDYRKESGYTLGKKLLKMRRRPSAIFVCNGVMTLGVLDAFEEMGIQCPEEVALGTFDDLQGGHSFHPRLTTVIQPSYEIGARAATILMDRVEGKLTGPSLVVRLAPTLMLGDSVSSHPARDGQLQKSNSLKHLPSSNGIRSPAARESV